MSKFIIPRKDHEVYFLPKPETIKNNKQLHQYVTDYMDKLHPAFSEKSKTDVKHLNFNNTHWLMITVMEEEVLAEYRFLNRHSILFTNTSITAYKDNFINNGIQTIDDEKIGYDTEKNEPVSIPLDIIKNNEQQELKNELKNVYRHHALFNKKIPLRNILLTSIFLPVIIIALLIFFNNNSTKDIIETEFQYNPQEVNQTETIIIKEFIPPVIEILASMSANVVDAGGKMLHWQCGEDTAPFMTVQLQGIDLLNAYRLFSNYSYAKLQDIQEVRYGDNEPYISVILEIDNTEYTPLPVKVFPAHDLIFPTIAELSGALINNDISIVSETLPAAGNGYLVYSISFSAIDWNLIRSLEIMSAVCNNNKLRIKNFSINNTNNRFHVSCTFSYCDDENFPNTLLGNEKYYIPLAFGYNWEGPSIEIAADDIEYKETIIGSIRDYRGKRTFYRDISGGKMQVRVE